MDYDQPFSIDEYLRTLFEKQKEQDKKIMKLEAETLYLRTRVDTKIDYDVQVNLERDFQLAMIQINTKKGGE